MKTVLLALLVASPAAAADLRDLCPDRPGLNTPPCIVDKGHLIVETGVAYTHDQSQGIGTDTGDYGELTVRYGVTDRVELVGGWTAYEHVRVRDRASGLTARTHGTGDLLFGVKAALTDPDGKGLAVSVQPFTTAPTGTGGVGAVRWTQGVIVPIKLELPADFELQMSPEIDRLPNNTDGGHHAAYTGVIGLGHKLGPFDAQVEAYVSHDDDPGARSTMAIADVNLALSVGKNLQFDAEVDAGLNRDTPDVRIAVGVARRF